MKTPVTCAALLILLAAPTWSLQDPSPGKGPCDVRVYLLDKDHKAAPIQGVSAVLVTADKTGLEKQVPMSVVTTPVDREKAPNCALQARPVEGTPYTAALCALSADGRVQDRPYRDEGGGPRADGQDPADLVHVDFNIPYFKASIPADHLCRPGCTTAIRFIIGGTTRSTSSFPCPVSGKAAVPTCCAAHQVRAEGSELKRQIQAHEREQAAATLDRISACVDRRDGSARTEQRRLDCAQAVNETRAALTSDIEEEALDAVDKLLETCDACFEACSRTEAK